MDEKRELELRHADLMVDKVYEGGRSGNASDDPLPHLIGVSNQGGFRYIGSKGAPRLAVLTTTLRNLDWPDSLDPETGIFSYFGDNKKPGHELHDTPRFGNLLLRDMFERAHGSNVDRAMVPPVLIFANTGSWRDVEFLGLAVPGVQNLDANRDLVAVWKTKSGKRFQNYDAKFTVLEHQVIPKKWINDVKDGEPLSANCPTSWRLWVEKGLYRPLKAPRAVEYRSPQEQLPHDAASKATIAQIVKHFGEDHYRFEACAVKIAELMLPNIASIDLTRRVRDGGRDAVGKYRIGVGASAVLVEFALEAKCYGQTNSVGVRELSRLISRLRHRQFGILVTTSYVALQAYKEIKEDGHPIVIIAARDIVGLLRNAGLNGPDTLLKWLSGF
jgi:Restriction endonuclease AspBHI N-terminal/Restriction endonuclease